MEVFSSLWDSKPILKPYFVGLSISSLSAAFAIKFSATRWKKPDSVFMPHDPQKLIEDLRISIGEINEFCEGKGFSDYESDQLLQRAIERELEIIGEVLNRLLQIDTEKVESTIPEFRSIIGLRNIIAHGYDVVDPMIVWDVVINHVPVLAQQIETYA